MMDRLLSSRHLDTVYGFVAATAGILIAVCTVVGFAVVLDAIAGWVT